MTEHTAFTVKIDTENDFFQPNAEMAVAGLLRSVADSLEYSNRRSGVVMDGNGNRVGRWQFNAPKDWDPHYA